MKKTVFTIGVLATALLMVACQKANLNDGEKTYVSKIGITIADEADTKTSLDMDTKKLSWVSGDQIRVFGFKDNEMWALNNLFTVDPSSISVDGHSADFTYTGSIDWSGAEKIAAVYGPKGANSMYNPGFSITTKLGNASNYVQLWYPRNQTYQAGGPKTTYLYMRALPTTDHDHLSFRNLTSVVKLPICDKGVSPITLKSIKLQCDNEPIGGRWYGYATATTSNGGTAANDYNVSSSWSRTYDNVKTNPGLDEGGVYGNVTSLTSINQALTSADQYFYIVVAPGAHGNLTVTLTDSADNTKTWTIASFTSVAGRVYKFPEIDWSSK